MLQQSYTMNLWSCLAKNKESRYIMRLNWNRIKRTFIQSASGAGIALVTAISADYSKQSLITAGIEFVSTVIIAVLMNIKNQADESEE